MRVIKIYFQAHTDSASFLGANHSNPYFRGANHLQLSSLRTMASPLRQPLERLPHHPMRPAPQCCHCYRDAYCVWVSSIQQLFLSAHHRPGTILQGASLKSFSSLSNSKIRWPPDYRGKRTN